MKIHQHTFLLLIVFSFTFILSLSSCKNDEENPVTSQEEKESIKKAIDTAVSDFITPEAFSIIIANVRIPSKDFEWTKGYVLRQPQSSLNVENSHFDINSVTNAFMAVLTMKLIEEKKLGLNDTLGQFFKDDTAKSYFKADPDLLDSICVYNGKSYGRQITVKMLLNHTSGIPEYNDCSEFVEYFTGNNTTNLDKRHILSIAMKQQRLTTEPGKYNFSNTNYTLLELIIENVTGKTIARLMKDYIYNPCDLKSTYFSLYEPLNKTLLQKNNPLLLSKTNFAGNVLGLYSTLGDIYRFFNSFNTGRILNTTSASNMLSFTDLGNDTTLNISFGYGMGLLHYSFGRINAYGIINESVLMLYLPEKQAYITAHISTGNLQAPYILFKKIAAAIQ